MPKHHFKRNVTQQYVLGIFIGIETLIYIIFLTLDYMKRPSVHMKYLSICICVIMAVYILKIGQSLIALAVMGITLIADTFLLLINDYYAIGVAAFCVVQTIYAARLMSHSGTKSLIPRMIFFLIAVITLKRCGLLDVLTFLSAWSYIQLVSNVIHVFFVRNKFAGGNSFAIGLLLFLACDTCVGLNNLINYIPKFPYNGMIEVASFCMWLFYLPSQVLIVLSFCNQHEINGKENFRKV